MLLRYFTILLIRKTKIRGQCLYTHTHCGRKFSIMKKRSSRIIQHNGVFGPPPFNTTRGACVVAPLHYPGPGSRHHVTIFSYSTSDTISEYSGAALFLNFAVLSLMQSAWLVGSNGVTTLALFSLTQIVIISFQVLAVSLASFVYFVPILASRSS